MFGYSLGRSGQGAEIPYDRGRQIYWLWRGLTPHAMYKVSS